MLLAEACKAVLAFLDDCIAASQSCCPKFLHFLMTVLLLANRAAQNAQERSHTSAAILLVESNEQGGQ